MAVTYIRVVPGIVPSLKALYAGHSPVKERSRYHQSVRWRRAATLCRQSGITETDGQDNKNHSYYHRPPYFLGSTPGTTGRKITESTGKRIPGMRPPPSSPLSSSSSLFSLLNAKVSINIWSSLSSK